MSLTKCPNCDDQHACHNVDSREAETAVANILFYIGWRAGKMAEVMSAPLGSRPPHLRVADIQVPARDIIALIRGDKTIHEVLAAADDEL